ncbi:MAG TPA: P-loop NTPase fold protein, partial [Cellvibrio sp.]
ARIGRSGRFDLLAAFIVGGWSNELAASSLVKVHDAIKSADPYWAPIIFIFLCIVLASPLYQRFRYKDVKNDSQLRFLEDKEILQENDDLLASEKQAQSFADTVLASGAHSGLVFGVDGPWGIGKTSFINLAERHWKQAADKVIVCRFEPLRYASEPDLADRLIRDLSAAIQKEVFAPEFRPAATRYSRLIKGKADISFLGFKLSLEPSHESADDLLDDIDEILRRIDRRVIIVIDDLDRLDTKTVNNVLFATRRTFKLTEATYILCYDTEVLVENDEGTRAREFLEKFVTIKLSLFVDSTKLRDFLRGGWMQDGTQFGSVPADTMIKLGAILSELAEILDGELAANYLPMVGDLRKIKRFINAILMMGIENTDLGRTDFHGRDLINLILLHLYYPGVFRRIYAEETGERSGTFSLTRASNSQEFKNDNRFTDLEKEVPNAAYFLLKQLFDVEILNLRDVRNIEESVRRSRACFNKYEFRNLESYLKFIVHNKTPEPQNTFILYKKAVEQVQNGTPIN